MVNIYFIGVWGLKLWTSLVFLVTSFGIISLYGGHFKSYAHDISLLTPLFLWDYQFTILQYSCPASQWRVPTFGKHYYSIQDTTFIHASKSPGNVLPRRIGSSNFGNKSKYVDSCLDCMAHEVTFPTQSRSFFGYNIRDVRASIVMENEWLSHEQLRSVLVHFLAKFLHESTVIHSSDTSSTWDSVMMTLILSKDHHLSDLWLSSSKFFLVEGNL